MRKLTAWPCAFVCLAMAVLATVAAAGQETAPLKVGVVLPLTGAYRNLVKSRKTPFLWVQIQWNVDKNKHKQPERYEVC